MASQTRQFEYEEAKLRSSCDQCALAKVGCNKEKPECSRCVKRGISCCYSATKRVKRIDRRRRATTENDISMFSPARHDPPKPRRSIHSQDPFDFSQMDCFGTSSGTHTPDTAIDSFAPSLTTASVPVTPPQNISPFTPDIFSDIFSNDQLHYNADDTIDFTETIASLEKWTEDGIALLDNSDTTETDFSGEKTASDLFESTVDILQNATDYQGEQHSSVGLFPPDNALFTAGSSSNFTNLNALFGSPAAMNTSTSHAPTSMSDSNPERTSGNHGCGCMVQVCALLGRPNLENPSMISSQWSSIEKILAENKDRVEKLKTIIRSSCSCLDSGYIVVMTSVVMLSILTCYAMVACGTNRSTGTEQVAPPQPTHDSGRVHDHNFRHTSQSEEAKREHNRRRALQEMLPQLAIVQLILNSTVTRLGEIKPPQLGGDTSFSQTARTALEKDTLASLLQGGEFNVPFSSSLIATLEQDISARIQQLSRAFIHWLRK